MSGKNHDDVTLENAMGLKFGCIMTEINLNFQKVSEAWDLGRTTCIFIKETPKRQNLPPGSNGVNPQVIKKATEVMNSHPGGDDDIEFSID